MSKASKKQKLKITFNLGNRELLGVAMAAILFLIGPIMIYQYLKTNAVTHTSETYTAQAINQAQGQGKVAGLSTIDDKQYFIIPLLNFRFDTTLNETPTIFFLLGAMLLVGGIAFAVTMSIDAGKRSGPKR